MSRHGLLFSLLAISLAYGINAASAQAPPGSTGELQPGDAIRVKIWREPDLSGEFVVSERRQVVLPKLGTIDIQDVSRDSLQRLLLAGYSATLRNPSIEVTLLRRVSILGAVKNPDVYQVDPTMTIASVLALAGGATSEGKRGEVQLRRSGARVSKRLSTQMQIDQTPLRSGDELYVPERSWFSRNTAIITASITAVAIVLASTVR